MPLQTTSVDISGMDAFDFAMADQTYTIAPGVTVEDEDMQGAYDSGFGGDGVVNYGNLVTPYTAVFFDGNNDQLYNAQGASILGYEGVNSANATAVIENDGNISGTDAGILGQAGLADVENAGKIYGRNYGIATDGAKIRNSGTISSAGDGISCASPASGSVTVVNSGAIEGYTASILVSGAGSVLLTNKGILEGTLSLTNTGGDTIYNQIGGEIDGNVKLGNGTNTFDGRGGTIEHGYIEGGTKTDTIYLGNDGEVENSGAGHDTIYGGAGADVFAFSTYAAANYDTIFGFDVSDDLLQLNHASFTKLAVGAAPTFSIGNNATSATDYLFYNSVSGGVYYDPDGSGSGAANLIAKLDPGLALTAHNFKVI